MIEQYTLGLFVLIGGLVFFITSTLRLSNSPTTKEKNLPYTIVEIVAGIVMFSCAAALIYLYRNFIPANSPACKPKALDYGVVNSGVDIGTFALNTTDYPANSFATARDQYLNAKGVKNGYFAWNGSVMRLLKSDAFALGLSDTPIGNWWVFGDLNNVGF